LHGRKNLKKKKGLVKLGGPGREEKGYKTRS